jgi:anion-transporting  ArsA/GET3 family ATPase
MMLFKNLNKAKSLAFA